MGLWLGLALLLVASGLIAFIGDALGRRIGRKRLTIFGLRPRNTAILFTVVTGMLIAGATVAVILLVSDDIRDRLLTYDEKVAQVERLNAEVGRLEGSANTARRVADQAKREAQTAGDQQRRAEARARAVAADLRRADDQLQAAARSLAGAGERLRRLQGERQRVQAQLVAAQRDLRTAGTQRDQARQRLIEADRRLVTVEREIAGATAELRNAQDAMGRVQDVYDRIQGEYDRLQVQVDTAQRSLSNALDREQQVRDRLAAAEAELRETERELRETDIAFQAGGELARMLVRLDSAERALERIDDLVRLTNRIARDGGAAELQPGVWAVPSGRTPAGEAVGRVYLEAVAQAVLAQGQQGAESLWLRATARYNTIAGRPVEYELELFEDRQVYLPGQPLASREIDGAAPPADLIRELERLVVEQVNPALARDGVLPNPDGRYTPVGPEVWFPALEELRRLGRRAKVTAVAAAIVRTGGPLVVRFEVAAGG